MLKRITRWCVRWVVLPVVALVALGGVGSEVGPAWQAKSGGGTPGTFTAGYETCGRRACTWYGDFAPGDGSPVRRDVILYDAPDELVRGGSAPARDTGARSGVFGASGGGFWVAATLFAAVGVAAALAWLVLLARAVRRRRALSGPGR